MKAELVKGLYFPVLDQGFVSLVDYMGGDAAIVEAARTSHWKKNKKSSDRDLLRLLVRHRHTSPLEMCELVFHIAMPMDAWRQHIRHRTASVSEYSTRYSEAIDAMARTASNAWRLQATKNRQGSEGFLQDPSISKQLTIREFDLQTFAQEVYKERVAHGIALEQARKDLPLSTYTLAYWKIDLHNLMHYLTLRCDSHAQKEIRDYAWVMAKLANTVAPDVIGAWIDYHFCSVTFSRHERRELKRKLIHDYLAPSDFSDFTTREIEEFKSKVDRLGDVTPPDLTLNVEDAFPASWEPFKE